MEQRHQKFMAEKGIQPDLIYTSEEADAHSIWNIWGSRRCWSIRSVPYEYQRCADPRKPVPLLGIYSTEVKPFFVRTVAILGGESSGNPPW